MACGACALIEPAVHCACSLSVCRSYPPLDKEVVFKTSAMAEGAIDGVGSDYEVASPFETRFKYSAFDHSKASPRNLADKSVGKLNTASATA